MPSSRLRPKSMLSFSLRETFPISPPLASLSSTPGVENELYFGDRHQRKRSEKSEKRLFLLCRLQLKNNHAVYFVQLWFTQFQHQPSLDGAELHTASIAEQPRRANRPRHSRECEYGLVPIQHVNVNCRGPLRRHTPRPRRYWSSSGSINRIAVLLRPLPHFRQALYKLGLHLASWHRSHLQEKIRIRPRGADKVANQFRSA